MQWGGFKVCLRCAAGKMAELCRKVGTVVKSMIQCQGIDRGPVMDRLVYDLLGGIKADNAGI